MLQRLFALVLVMFSPLSWAAMTFSTNIHPDLYHLSANAACASLKDEADNPMVGPNGVVEGVYADGSLTCFYRYSDPSQFGGTRTGGFSVGGVTPRAISKECKAGDPFSITWPIGPTDATNPSDILGTPNLPPSPICSAGCSVNLGDASPSDCYTFQDGSSPFTFCDFAGTLTGDACSSADEPSPPDTTSCPPGTVAQGSGCAPETPPDPCEADPNAAGCTPPDPCVADPNAAGCPGGGDTGGGDTGGGDDCTANPTAEGCTGGGDTGGGDTGGGDTGGGDTGGGDNGGGDSGGDGNNGSATGLSCEEPLTCSGDAIQCATLQFQKSEYCSDQAAMDYPKQRDAINDFLNQPNLKPEDDEEVDLGSMFSEGTRFLPSGCPSPESVVLSSAGGRTFQFSYEPLCQLATDLSYLIVAAAGIFFAVYVGRAVGG